MKTSFKIAGAVLLLATSMQAQMLTLEDYQKKVLAYDKSLQVAKQQSVIAEANKKAVKVGFLPQLDFQGSYRLDLNSLTGGNDYNPHNYSGELILSQNIWKGGSVRYNYNTAKISQEISEQGVSLTYDNIMFGSEQVYWTAAANYDLYKKMEEYQGIVAKLYDIINFRFEKEDVSKTDLAAIKTRLKEAENQVIVAKRSYLIANHNLNVMMGIPPEEQNNSLLPISSSIALPELSIADTAINSRPDYIQAAKQIDLTKEQSKINVSKLNPQVNVGVRGGYGTVTPNLNAEGKFTGSAFLSVSVPIFHWGERGQINASNKAKIFSQQLNLERTQDNIRNEIENAKVSVRETTKQISISEENLEIAQENLDLTTFSYNEGRLPIVDVITAQLSWVQANVNLISAQLSQKIAIADFKRAVSTY